MIQKLINQIQEKNAPIIVGLDPTMKLMPKTLVEKYFAEYGQTLEAVGEAMFDYNRQIMDACADLIPAVKPQIAMYESFGIPGMIEPEVFPKKNQKLYGKCFWTCSKRLKPA